MWSRWSVGGVSLAGALLCLFILDQRPPSLDQDLVALWPPPSLFIPPPSPSDRKAAPNSVTQKRNRRWEKSLGPFLQLMNVTGLPVFLSHGTLLGWARGEEFIGDTTDIDLAARIQDFRPEWLQLMANLSRPRLEHNFGADVTTSMELSFMVGPLKIDVFFTYPVSPSSNAFYMPGVYSAKNSLLFWDYNVSTPLRICHSLLRDIRVQVPCQWEEMLQLEYGPTWRVPVPNSNWTWYSSAANIRMGPRQKGKLLKSYKARAPNPKRDQALITAYIARFLSPTKS